MSEVSKLFKFSYCSVRVKADSGKGIGTRLRCAFKRAVLGRDGVQHSGDDLSLHGALNEGWRQLQVMKQLELVVFGEEACYFPSAQTLCQTLVLTSV